MVGRYKSILVIILSCLSVLPLALRAQGYQTEDWRQQYHASSVYYVTLQNAAGENINSQYATVDGAIGAFVGSELRGTSQWMPTGSRAGQGVFFIRVWGGKDDPSTATFRLRDQLGLEYQIGSQEFSQDEEGAYGSPSAPVSFTVVPVTGITLPATEITLKVGDTHTLQTTLTPEGHSALLTALSYTYSSNSAAFTVSSSGIISADAVGQGKVTVKTSPGNFTAEATVKVEAAPEKIHVTEIRNNMASNQIEMEEGDELLLDFSVLPENATDKAVKFTNDYDIVDIKQETESSPVTIVAKKAGEDVLTVISVDNEQATLTYNITVKKKVIPVTKIEVTPATLDAYVGETYNFTLKVLPETATNKSLEATVENTAVIDLDADNQQITAKAVGTSKVTFRAKDGSDVEAVMTVTVRAVPEVTLSFATQTLTASKLHDRVLTLTKGGNADFLPSRVELVFSKAANGEPAATATMADETGLKWNVRGHYIGSHTIKIKYNGKEQAASCQMNTPAEYSIIPGWDWISFYAAPSAGLALPGILNSISAGTNDVWRVNEIRSQQQFIHYDLTHGYFGDLAALTATGGSYRFLTSNTNDNVGTLEFSVGYDKLSKASLDQQLVPGYTWIAYPYELDHSIERLVTELSAVATNDDMIIGRDGFAVYNGEEWIVTENFVLQAGKGYVYYNAGKSEKTLRWTSSNLTPDPAPVASRQDAHSRVMYRHPETMAVVAMVSDQTVPEGSAVRAYVGQELRGEAALKADGRCNMAVAGSLGETVAFVLVNEANGLETPLPQSVAFAQKAGSPKAPLLLDIVSATGAEDMMTEGIYDLQGRRLEAAPLKGIYLKATMAEGRVTVKKIIKK